MGSFCFNIIQCHNNEIIIIFIQSVCFLNIVEGKVNSCIACTSKNGVNPDCEENPESFPATACDEQYGNDYCYTLVTHNKKPTESWVWNRGCCRPTEGSSTCPISKPDHEKNEYYEFWRNRCESDNCNIEDPRDNVGGGGSSDGGVVVHGKSGASGYFNTSFICFITLVLVSFINM